MLVQACPSSSGGLGSYSSSPYCGLVGSSSSASDFSPSPMITLPIVQEDDGTNGNDGRAVNGVVDNVHDKYPNLTPAKCYLVVESDEITTESQVLNIETTIKETFTLNEEHDGFVDRDRIPDLDNGSATCSSISESDVKDFNRDVYSDSFERAFEVSDAVQEMVISPGSPSSSSSSSRSRVKVDSDEDDKRHGAGFSEEFQKKSCLDKTQKLRERDLGKEAEGERGSGHRVTFNDKNEIASQDMDGTFKVTYRQLGEKIKRIENTDLNGREEGKKSALRCVVAERGKLETATTQISPRIIDFDSYDDLADYALPSEQREMRREDGEWDNPFQPEGEVSHDAELMVQLWKGGRLGHDSLAAEIAKAASAESSLASSPLHAVNSNPPVVFQEDSQSTPSDNNVNNSANKHSPVKKQDHQAGTNYQIVLSEKQKHKNKLKKHCSMM